MEASIFLQSRNLYNHSIDFLQPFYRNRRYADVISVCFQYGIRRDFEEAYKDFLEMSWYDVQTEQLSHLPPAALLFTLRVRQDMDIHRRRVALESPKFKEHDPTCSDPDGCGDDWHTLWWNVVGTGLCNGHEQLTYSRAVERLKMASTGRMSRKCFEQLVAVAESAQGWGHIYDLTSTAAVKVMEFIPDPPF